LETLVRMNGVPEDILELLISQGYYKTKTEAFRAGILKLGEEYNLLKSLKELELELVALKIKEQSLKNKKKVSEKEVQEKYGFK